MALRHGRVRVRGVEFRPHEVQGWGRHDHYFTVPGSSAYRTTGPDKSIHGYGAAEAAMIASATRRGLRSPLSAPKLRGHLIQKVVVTLGVYLVAVSLWKAGSRKGR